MKDVTYSKSDLDLYVNRFRQLKSDRVRWTHSPDTLRKAPHKPLLLIALIDLIEGGAVEGPQFSLDGQLIETFQDHWRAVIGSGRPGNPVLPAYHLRSERAGGHPFWILVPRAGHESDLAQQIRQYSVWDETVDHIELAQDLAELLRDQEARIILRATLVGSKFSASAGERLDAATQLSIQISHTAQGLASAADEPFKLIWEPGSWGNILREIRDAAFRRLVLPSYQHQCSVCAIRIITPEGRSLVQAAHIASHSETHNNDPRNGIAMCGVHHWCFDEGLLGISKKLEVLVSPLVDQFPPGAETLIQLRGRRYSIPESLSYRPSPEAIQWHLKNRFRSES